jgi:hopanoid biosynthesis associated protein HpnK
MVSAPAAGDAVARAREMPNLRVGLHLVLVEGRPTLAPSTVPDLVDRTGNFRTDMARAGLDMFLRPAVRRQLAAEIEAQFAAFTATGLTLDHVNAHKHFHLHPTIAGLVLAIGRRHGMKCLRVPAEPAAVLRALDPAARNPQALVMAPWVRALRARARRAGMSVPEVVFGLAWSGRVTTARLAGLLAHLPPGDVEIYLHPATADRFAGAAPGYGYRDELAALCAEEVAAALKASGRRLSGYREEDPSVANAA